MSANGKQLHSASWIRMIWRKTWWMLLVLLALYAVPFIAFSVPVDLGGSIKTLGTSLYKLLCLTVLLFVIISVCRSLTDYFSLKKKENGITWCQILILFSVVLWILAFLIIFNIQKESKHFLVIGIVGTMLGWIFQDTIKGVVAFIHLRINHLLCIDDWIAVPSLKVDGEVKHFTLTTVTIYNWDTTVSSIPTDVCWSKTSFSTPVSFIPLPKKRPPF